MACVWYHGVRGSSIKRYVKYGILPSNELKKMGSFNPYSDSRPMITYVTSAFDVALGFSRPNEDILPEWNFTHNHQYPHIVLCMDAIQVLRRDRNGDRGAVEVRGRIRPEYLFVHNYKNIEGLCWPLLWVAKENGLDVS